MFLLNIALYKYIDVKGTKKVGWHYLGRFVFNGEESVGRITYDLDGLVTNQNTKLYFYSDANLNWREVYKTRKNCNEITSARSYTQVFNKKSHQFQVDRIPAPSFWYVAVANCVDGFDVDGYIHFEDVEWSTEVRSYNREFDFSQQTEIEMTAFFACVYGALFIEQLYAFFGIMRPKRHLFIILVLISTGSIAVGYLFRLIWAAAYSQNGRSQAMLWIAGVIIQSGECLLILIAMFIGQGYLISSPTMKYAIVTWILFGCEMFMGLFSQLWYLANQNDPQFGYQLEQIPGVVYNITRLICAGFFLFACFRSRLQESYETRRALYTTFLIIFGFEIMTPFIAYLIGFAFDPWFRYQFVNLMIRSVDVVAVLVIVYTTNPENVEDNFRVQGVTGEVKHDPDELPVDADIAMPGALH